MMARPLLPLLTGTLVIGLGCGGLLVDDHAVTGTAEAIASAPPDLAPTFLLVGGAQAGLVNPVCASNYELVAHASPETRDTFAAKTLWDAPSCPGPCVGQADSAAMAALDGPGRMAFARARCPEPDPIFAGDLEPLASSAAALPYLMNRLLLERASGTALDTEIVREQVAVGLALLGRPGEPPATLTVTGVDADDALLHALRTACPEGPLARAVIDPTGAVRGAAGGCGTEVLSAHPWPPGGWRVVDAHGG